MTTSFTVNPVATQIKPMPTMSLAEMMNFARGAQQYQQEQIALTLEQQKEQERARIQELMRDPALFQTPEGRMDIERLNQLVPRIAPLTGPALVQQLTTLDTNQTAAAQAAQNLTQDQRTMIASRLAILGRLKVEDPRAYMAELDQLRAENPNNPQLHRLTEAYKNTLRVLSPGANLPSLAISAANSLLSPQTQQQMFAGQPGQVSTGAAIFPTVTEQPVAGGAPRVQVGQTPLAVMQLPPGSREQFIGYDPITHQPVVNVYSPSGRFEGQRSAATPPTAGQLPGATPYTPTGQPPMQPGMQQPMQPGMPPGVQVGVVRPPDIIQRPGQEPTPVPRMRPGETPETYKAANEIRMNAANAARTVSDQTFNNNEIIKLADNVILGRGAQFIGALSGGYAQLPFTTDNATNLNKIGHFMALQTASLAQSSGLAGTDAARNIAGEVAGTTNWTADAVKHTARINRSLATATDLFNQGVQNAFNRTKEPISARDFQNQWSQTVDMNAVRLFDAMRNNDKEAIREVVTAAGGPNSPGYKRLVTNIGAMQRLIQGR